MGIIEYIEKCPAQIKELIMTVFEERKVPLTPKKIETDSTPITQISRSPVLMQFDSTTSKAKDVTTKPTPAPKPSER